MIIERLQLRDFGIYGGQHTFDLAPDLDGKRPIILIEGHNGAGKTTFLEAIRLALYGKAALGPRVSQKAYETLIRDRLHRGTEGTVLEIVLTLSRNEDGALRRYSITRRWQVDARRIDEDLYVAVDGAVPAETVTEDWQHILDDMVPPGVSQLFFFDGEKIQDIAHGDASAGLQQAIRPLLGLDIIEQLRTDLALFVARQKADGGVDDLGAASSMLDTLTTDLGLAEEKRAQLASDLDQATARIRREETAYRREGGREATGIDDAKVRKRAAEEERQGLLHELRDVAAGSGPLLLARSTMDRLRATAKDAEHQRARLSAGMLLDEFERQMPPVADVDRALWARFRKFASANPAPLPRWAEGSLDVLRRRTELAVDDMRAVCLQLATRLDENAMQIQAAEEQIEAFAKGAGDVALDGLRKAEFKRGELTAALEKQDALVAELRAERARAQTRCERLHDAIFATARLDRSAALAGKARTALITYEERVLSGRIAVLEDQVLVCLKRLLRRPGLVDRIQVEPETFDIALFGANDEEIALDSLSAGERQLFAVALLWALAKTSDRALPLVIDTPLGRLDRMHRARIVDQYLAGAGEQVILLCTDTELTDDIAAQLQPHVSRQVSLGVESGMGQTQITPRHTKAHSYAAV